ncbi:MAG: hypothetical protein DRP89_05185 [Candidatus Neomarinimicrobiota bacterium]|nr:MAG: hypothetical protein DRP89_05185 [Candidatus Neomarinimicrobiota bacterium]
MLQLITDITSQMDFYEIGLFLKGSFRIRRTSNEKKDRKSNEFDAILTLRSASLRTQGNLLVMLSLSKHEYFFLTTGLFHRKSPKEFALEEIPSGCNLRITP